jgi:hypothetical protein
MQVEIAEETPQPMLAHIVYFTLKNPSDASIQALVDACQEHLGGHPGTLYFSVGRLVEDLARPVNDRDFHVGLHVIFDGREAHDVYQTSPRHVKFIDENKESWQQVRVFDTSDAS